MDSLGDRIKRYERAYQHTLTPRMPVMIRVDGRAFHTYTKGFDRPFDRAMILGMQYATEMTSREMQGFLLAYTQSDEATFLITDTQKLDTQGWFGYEHSKIVSLTASIFSGYFNNAMHGDLPPASFDARAFSIPLDDAPNAFIWRQRDWERNSLQMLASYYFSHKQLQGKGRRHMHDMLHGVGVNWAELQDWAKNGTFFLRDRRPVCEKADYNTIYDWIAS